MTRHVVLVRIGGLFEIIGNPPVGMVGDAYSYTFTTAGGTGPITWACFPNPVGASGASFSAGVLSSASLLAGGSFAFTLVAVDANGQRAIASFVLVVVGVEEGLIREDPDDDDILTEGGILMIAE
jgi:hypothetical protein